MKIKYRYFYNQQGVIISQARYTSRCFSTGTQDTVGYIDLDHEISTEQHLVNVQTQQLVPQPSD